MDPELKEAHERIDALHEYCKINSQMIFMLKSGVDRLFENANAQRKMMKNLSELTELNHKLVEELEQDQIEMADDITKQFDAYQQKVSRFASLISSEYDSPTEFHQT